MASIPKSANYLIDSSLRSRKINYHVNIFACESNTENKLGPSVFDLGRRVRLHPTHLKVKARNEHKYKI